MLQTLIALCVLACPVAMVAMFFMMRGGHKKPGDGEQ